MGESQITFIDEAEHVVVTRSVDGNMANILIRFASFKNAIGAIVSCGLARGQTSNPACSLRILAIYGTPVLMSGLGSLVLSSNEISIVNQQYKRALQGILKLAVDFPPALIYFSDGSLPGSALLHWKQLALFGMICRLPGNPLNIH